MRQVSPELAAAIESPVRVLLPERLMVDWDRDGYGPAGSLDDLSRHVLGSSSDGTLQGDLPDAVRIVSGNVARSLDVDLGGGSRTDDTIGTVPWWSPVAPPSPDTPLAGRRRRFLPCFQEVGFVTETGPQYVRTFTGRTSNLAVATGRRTAQLQAIDNRALLRTQVSLPAVIADAGVELDGQVFRSPGMDGTWLVSYAAAMNGVYASPGPRPGCRFWAPMHGSGQPFIHDTVSGLAQAQDYPAGDDGNVASSHRLQFTDGPYVLALTSSVTRAATVVGTAQPGGTPLYDANGRSRCRIEAWVRVPDGFVPGGGSPDTVVAEVTVAVDEGIIRVHRDGSAHFTMDGVEYLTMPAGTMPAGQWAMVGWCWDQITGTYRATANGTSGTGTFTPYEFGGAPDGEQWAVGITAADGGRIAEVQVTAGIATGTGWLDELPFTPGATLEPSTNQLDAIVPADPRDPWDLVKEVAAAERAATYFDADGVLRFRTGGGRVDTAAQDDQLVVTSTRKITDLQFDDDISRVANVVSCPYVQITHTGGGGTAWEPDETVTAPAHQTLTLWADLTAPVVGNTVGLIAAVNSKDDGSGTNYGNKVQWPTRDLKVGPLQIHVELLSATTAKLTLTNNSAGAVYLVDTTGQSTFAITGATVTADTGPVAPTVRDETSISGDGTWDGYGEQPLTLDDNPWRQSRSAALSIAQQVLGDTADPPAVITALEIVGDPRVEYLDRIRIRDADGARLDGPYLVRGIAPRRAGNEYRMTLVAVAARDVARYDVGRYDTEVYA